MVTSTVAWPATDVNGIVGSSAYVALPLTDVVAGSSKPESTVPANVTEYGAAPGDVSFAKTMFGVSLEPGSRLNMRVCS